MGRAQLSFEFIFTIIMGLIFFAIISTYFTAQLNNIRFQNIINDVDDLGESLQIELSTAASIKNGYIREIKIPKEIANIPYQITIKKNELVIVTNVYEHVSFIPSVKGNFTPGINYISKKNNQIYITQ